MDLIFKKYGYPNERIIGVELFGDTIVRNIDNFDVLLIHLIKNHKEKYKNFLKKSVLNGQMKNSTYEFHSKNFLQTKGNKLNCLQVVQGLVIQVNNDFFTCCCEEEQAINIKRKSLFLPHLEDMRRRIRFNEKGTIFNLNGGLFKYSNISEEDEIEIKNELRNEGFVKFKM